MQKARRQPLPRGAIGLRQLVSKWFQVLFHSPKRGTFHLSLALLLRYRSSRSNYPYGVVPADSHQVSRVWHYSGALREALWFSDTGLSPAAAGLSMPFS